MILQWLAETFAGLLVSFIGLFPTFTLPDWWQTALDYWNDTLETAGQLGYWFPLPLIALVAAAIVAAVGISIAVKLIRIVASFFTLGGGSAA